MQHNNAYRLENSRTSGFWKHFRRMNYKTRIIFDSKKMVFILIFDVLCGTRKIGAGTGRLGSSIPDRGKILFSPSKRPDWRWGRRNRLSNECRGFFGGEKRPVREVDHSRPSSAVLKNEWSYTSPPPCMSSWRGQGHLYGLTFYTRMK
jgi:hypothetical protein